jgi:hypothetical protein
MDPKFICDAPFQVKQIKHFFNYFQLLLLWQETFCIEITLRDFWIIVAYPKTFSPAEQEQIKSKLTIYNLP